MNKQGFTLVETLLYALLVGMIVSGLISFSLAMISIKAKSEIIAEINANINDLGDIISREVKTAQEIITPGPGQSSERRQMSISGLCSGEDYPDRQSYDLLPNRYGRITKE